jgi:hypothetical protein
VGDVARFVALATLLSHLVADVWGRLGIGRPITVRHTAARPWCRSARRYRFDHVHGDAAPRAMDKPRHHRRG